LAGQAERSEHHKYPALSILIRMVLYHLTQNQEDGIFSDIGREICHSFQIL